VKRFFQQSRQMELVHEILGLLNEFWNCHRLACFSPGGEWSLVTREFSASAIRSHAIICWATVLVTSTTSSSTYNEICMHGLQSTQDSSGMPYSRNNYAQRCHVPQVRPTKWTTYPQIKTSPLFVCSWAWVSYISMISSGAPKRAFKKYKIPEP